MIAARLTDASGDAATGAAGVPGILFLCMKRVRMGLIKELPVRWSVEENWRTIERLVRLHSRDGVDIYVTPECFLDGCSASEGDWTPQRFEGIAQRIEDSPYIEALSRTAATHSTHIVCGFTERVGERYYNCSLLVGRSGEILGKYQKTHLQEHDRHIAGGANLPVFALDCGQMGILTFSEWRWPEAVRSLRLQGRRSCCCWATRHTGRRRSGACGRGRRRTGCSSAWRTRRAR